MSQLGGYSLAATALGQQVNPGALNIQGQIPFTTPQVGQMFSGNPGDLGSSYQNSYSNALSQNAANYQNVLQGYQQTLAAQQTQQGAIGAGYGQLANQVQQGIQGITASQKQAIQDVYASQSGSAQQQLINSGLGNSTVLSSVNRGLGLDEQKAQIALANQQAQLQAGYQSSLGLAGLNYANQANMQNTALAGQQLGFQNSVTSQYPSVAPYSQLAMQQGQIGQANLDRQAAARAQQLALSPGGGGGQLAQQRSGLPPGFGQGGTSGMNNAGVGYGGGMSSVTPYGMGGGGGQMIQLPSGPPTVTYQDVLSQGMAGTAGGAAGAMAPQYGGFASGAQQTAPDNSNIIGAVSGQDYGGYYGE